MAVQSNEVELGACQACGFVQGVPEVPRAAALLCRRCGDTLRQVRRRSVLVCSACAVLGLMLFVVAFYEPVASVVMQGGRFATTDLMGGPERLRSAGAWLLTLAVVTTLVLMPFAKLATVAAMAAAVHQKRVPFWLRRAFAALPVLSQWAMIEVFLLGAMIALFRLRDWMLVDYGPSLYALAGAALCSIGIDASIDRAAFWKALPLRPSTPSTLAPPIGCHGCDLLADAPHGAPCPRCGTRLHHRKADSVRRTWALLAAAALFAIPANVWPVMTVVKLGQGGPSTILGGTIELTEAHLWGLAALVFVASVVVPLIKLGTLSFLLVATQRRSSNRLIFRTRLFRLLALIGRWSMIDVFATMMLATLARFGWLGTVRPEAGATAFCAVVVLTMFASESFDPRLMWDAAGYNQPRELSARQGVVLP